MFEAEPSTPSAPRPFPFVNWVQCHCFSLPPLMRMPSMAAMKTVRSSLPSALSSPLALAYKIDAEPPPFLPQVLSSSSHSRPALWTTSDSLDWAPTAEPLHALPLAAGAHPRSTSTMLTPFDDRPPSVETHRSSSTPLDVVPRHPNAHRRPCPFFAHQDRRSSQGWRQPPPINLFSKLCFESCDLSCNIMMIRFGDSCTILEIRCIRVAKIEPHDNILNMRMIL
jgi:hypothetical protein